MGVWGVSRAPSGTGDPVTTNAVGVRGESLATSSAGFGVVGEIPAAADRTCTGVRGDANGGAGTGVEGVTGTGWGVIGRATQPNGGGVSAFATDGIAFYAQNNVVGLGQPVVYAQTGDRTAIAFYGAGGIFLEGPGAVKEGGGQWTAPSDPAHQEGRRRLQARG